MSEATSRRALLGGLVGGGLALAGCAGTKPKPAPVYIPPIHVDDLAAILPRAGLRWLVRANLREVAGTQWLGPAIARIVPEQRLEAFAMLTGFDLRKVPDVLVATYGGAGGEDTVYLVRHGTDATLVERAFRERLVTDVSRSEIDKGLIHVAGRVGTSRRTLYLLGNDAACFQYGGDEKRGPARVASLYAQGKIKKSPTIFAAGPLLALQKRLGSAPVLAFAPGPFEGELARGARGLASAAVAMGAALRLTARQHVGLSVAVMGEFGKSGPEGQKALETSWRDLTAESFGHLLGLDAPIAPPLLTHGPDAVALQVELDAEKLSKGLRAATGAKIDEIMK